MPRTEKNLGPCGCCGVNTVCCPGDTAKKLPRTLRATIEEMAVGTAEACSCVIGLEFDLHFIGFFCGPDPSGVNHGCPTWKGSWCCTMPFGGTICGDVWLRCSGFGQNEFLVHPPSELNIGCPNPGDCTPVRWNVITRITHTGPNCNGPCITDGWGVPIIDIQYCDPCNVETDCDPFFLETFGITPHQTPFTCGEPPRPCGATHCQFKYVITELAA